MNEELQHRIDFINEEIKELQHRIDFINEEIKELQQRVADIEEEIDEIDHITDMGEMVEYGLWKPKEEEKYWTIMPTRAGIDYFMNAYGDDVDLFNFSIGNCYPTQEAAEKALEHKKIHRQLEDIAARLNKGREFDWKDSAQNKYFLEFYCYGEYISQRCGNCIKTQGVIYCLDDNFKEVAKQEIGEERLKEYLKEC